MHVGLIADVLGGEVAVAVDGAGARAGPVLADQGALAGPSARDHRRRSPEPWQAAKRNAGASSSRPPSRLAGRLLADDGLDAPTGLGSRTPAATGCTRWAQVDPLTGSPWFAGAKKQARRLRLMPPVSATVSAATTPSA